MKNSILLMVFFSVLALQAQVKPAHFFDNNMVLHPLFADHAVIQRDARVPVWGWCGLVQPALSPISLHCSMQIGARRSVKKCKGG